LLFLSLLAEELPGGGCKRKLLSSELKCGFDFSRKKSAALVSSIHQRREESPGWKMEADQKLYPQENINVHGQKPLTIG